MKFFLVFLLAILTMVLQLTLMPRLAILAVAPNLILAGVLAFAIWQSEYKKNWLILIPVLLFDLIAGRPFGLLTIVLWLVFFGIERLGATFLKHNDRPAILSLIFVGILLFELCKFLLSRLFFIWHLAEPINLTAFYFYAVLPISILYNGGLTLLLLEILSNSKLFKNYESFAKFK